MTQTGATIHGDGWTVHGIPGTDGSSEFRGIRFANAARFADPVDLDLTGEVDATRWGLMCPQTPGFLETMVGYDSESAGEDCLHLNVFTPPGARPDSKLPVLVWIHGGAYLNGAGSLAWYHGARLAARGAVVVTVNYRLGALGFLGRDNFGTLDQISSLRWVSKYVADFGGDPSNVTIFGESAGGSAVISLMAAPGAVGLFRRVWAMSPSIGQLRTLQRAESLLSDYLAILGCTDVADAATKSTEELLAAQNTLIARPSAGYDFFSPAGGGSGLDPDVLGAAARNPVPLVIGTTRDENKLFSAFNAEFTSKGQTEWIAASEATFGDRAAEARAVYAELRGGEPWELISAVTTDVAFRQHARRLAEARVAADTPTWMYWFTFASTSFGGRFGSCHALDIPFAFDTLDAQGAEALTGDSPARRGIADRFGHELVALATHGHPSWAQYDLVRRSTLVIDAETTLVEDPEPEIRALFERP